METVSLLRIGWLHLAVMAVGLVAVYEVCFRLGRRRSDEARDARRSQIDLAVTALLTLLGLLLAFSFELGASQFEKRRDLVVEDANAIATTYLRADLLPAPHAERVRGLLGEYISVRANVHSLDELHAAIRAADSLNDRLWAEATAAGQERNDSPIVARFIESLNKMLDLEETEVNASLYQRLPRAIFAVLYFVSFVSIGLFGIRGGLDSLRGLVSAIVLITVIIAVIGLVDSLDNPGSRLFQISEHAIRDTQHMIGRAHTAMRP